MNSLVEELYQDNKESKSTDPVTDKKLWGNREIKVSSVAGMSKERVNSMGDKLVIWIFFVPDEMSKVAFSSEKCCYSQSLSEDHKYECRINQIMMILSK